jgi:hypothetical protein
MLMAVMRSDHASGRCRRFIGILLTILVLGATVGTTPAGATPNAGASLRIWVQVQLIGARRSVCVGDQLQFRATVWKGTGVWAKMAQLPGVAVEASVSGAGGTVSPESSRTSLRGSPPGSVLLTYTAVKAGADVLEVLGTVDSVQFLGIEMGGTTARGIARIQVVDCKYRISATSRWRVKGDAKIAVVAKIEFAGVADDGNGHFSGLARVQWSVSTGQVGNCKGAVPPESEATVTGVRQGEDKVKWDIAYRSADAQISINCQGTGGSKPITMQPDPLTFTFPSEGGGKPVPHVLGKPFGDRGQSGIFVRAVAPK